MSPRLRLFLSKAEHRDGAGALGGAGEARGAPRGCRLGRHGGAEEGRLRRRARKGSEGWLVREATWARWASRVGVARAAPSVRMMDALCWVARVFVRGGKWCRDNVQGKFEHAVRAREAVTG